MRLIAIKYFNRLTALVLTCYVITLFVFPHIPKSGLSDSVSLISCLYLSLPPSFILSLSLALSPYLPLCSVFSAGDRGK